MLGIAKALCTSRGAFEAEICQAQNYSCLHRVPLTLYVVFLDFFFWLFRGPSHPWLPPPQKKIFEFLGAIVLGWLNVKYILHLIIGYLKYFVFFR